jgi:hypothetical protein
MTGDKILRILINLVGLALIAFIVWFFWLVKANGVKACSSRAATRPTSSCGRAGQARAVELRSPGIGVVQRDGAPAGVQQVGAAPRGTDGGRRVPADQIG